MTHRPASSYRLHPAHPAGSARPELVLIAGTPDLPPPADPAIGTAAAASEHQRAATGRHLVLVIDPSQGAPE